MTPETRETNEVNATISQPPFWRVVQAAAQEQETLAETSGLPELRRVENLVRPRIHRAKEQKRGESCSRGLQRGLLCLQLTTDELMHVRTRCQARK